MDEQLNFLKAVIEGEPLLERWKDWFTRNEAVLAAAIPRTLFLELKIYRISAIPDVLKKFDIAFVASDRNNWLGTDGIHCRDCGGKLVRGRFYSACPNGCFHMSWH